ncbi:hypothetical protein GCM10010345_54120 [Streptomyces canarius]|uniref:Uncharacterized protein n=1 Tax=Streptomyces canarius TaxID=285453 RepID=A0ABQ3CYS4_9ACTN|nr:hypothetical protein GCM10010345_54120 [Streptomyces canarius]
MWTRPYGGGRGGGVQGTGVSGVVRCPPLLAPASSLTPRPCPLTPLLPYSLPTNVSSVASGGQAKRTGV